MTEKALLHQLQRPCHERSTAAMTFIRVSKSDGQWRVEGTPNALLGRLSEQQLLRWPIGYARWSWDGQEVRASNCRYGVLPVYFYHDDTQIILSETLAPFMKHLKLRADDEAIAVTVRLPFAISGSTPLPNVRRLPPGSELAWREGKFRLSSQLPKLLPPFSGSRKQAVDKYIELFKAAIDRCAFLLEDSALAISGGRDSRHILFEMWSRGNRPRYTFTALHVPPRQDHDATTGARIAKRLQLPHRILKQPDWPLSSYLEHNVLTDFTTWEHPWLMTVRKNVRDVTSTADGLAGGVLSSGFLSKEGMAFAARKDWDAAARNVLNYWNGNTASVFLSKAALSRFSEDLAFEALRRELKVYSGSPKPLRDFYLWNRTSHAVSMPPYRLMNHTVSVTPYLDHNVFDFLLALPDEMTSDKEFHSETIRRGYPNFSDLAFEPRDFGHSKNGGYWRRFGLEMIRYFATRHRWLNKTAGKSLIQSVLTGDRIWWGPARAIFSAQLSELLE
jgi:asparagine synthase (glutamine-hydrolysing)